MNSQKNLSSAFIVTSSNVPKQPLHFQFRCGEVVTIAEVFTLLAGLPCVQVNIQSAVSVAWPLAVYGDLKHPPGHCFSELKVFQVRVNGAKTTFHVYGLFFVRDSRGLIGRDFLAIGNVDVFDVPAEPLRHSGSVCGVRLLEVPDLPLLNVVRNILHAGNNVANQPLALVGFH